MDIKEIANEVSAWCAKNDDRSAIVILRDGTSVLTGLLADEGDMVGLLYSAMKGKHGDEFLGCIDKAVAAYLKEKKKMEIPVVLKPNKYKS